MRRISGAEMKEIHILFTIIICITVIIIASINAPPRPEPEYKMITSNGLVSYSAYLKAEAEAKK